MAGDLRDTINHYIGKYWRTFERRLGITKDDLLNDIREQIWKGVLTHKPNGKANLKTYLNRLINNRFLVLLKKSSIDKNNFLDYYGDLFSSTGIEEETLVTEETGETIFEKRQVIIQDMAALSDADKLVYVDLILGKSIQDIMTERKLPRIQVIGMINRIDEMIKRRLKNG